MRHLTKLLTAALALALAGAASAQSTAITASVPAEMTPASLATAALGVTTLVPPPSAGHVADEKAANLPAAAAGPAALTIASGAIRIPNAHLSTTTPAFRVIVTNQNSTVAPGAVLIAVDHPLLNGDPNALAYLTPNGKLVGTTLVFPYSAATLAFSPASQRWLIVQGNRNNEAPLADYLGQQYTILVIKP